MSEGLETYIMRAALIGLCRLSYRAMDIDTQSDLELAVIAPALRQPDRAVVVVYAVDWVLGETAYFRWDTLENSISVKEDGSDGGNVGYHFQYLGTRLPVLFVARAGEPGGPNSLGFVPNIFYTVNYTVTASANLRLVWHFAFFTDQSYAQFLQMLGRGGIEVGEGAGFNVPPFA